MQIPILCSEGRRPCHHVLWATLPETETETTAWDCKRRTGLSAGSGPVFSWAVRVLLSKMDPSQRGSRELVFSIRPLSVHRNVFTGGPPRQRDGGCPLSFTGG